MNQWRKDVKQAFLAALHGLTNDQRVAIAQIVNQLATDPTSIHAISYPNGDREVFIAGLWLRFCFDARTRVITFLNITK